MDDLLKKSRGLKTRIIEINNYTIPLLNSPMADTVSKIITKIINGVNKAKKDYKKEIKIPPKEEQFASEEFWDEIIEKAKTLGIGLIGFTPIDENFIFENDSISRIKFLYDNGIVLGMEMNYDAMETAPEAPAGIESLNIYAELGHTMNQLADFIRSKGFRAIVCHPLGGPILFPAMAVKANMGEIGRQGLLISKNYGPRQRLSMIATNASPLPEHTPEDFKIHEYCKKCGICIKKCPSKAIYEEPIINQDGTISHIDWKKCIEYFYKTTGCSICIQVCPFHKIGYKKIFKDR